MKVLHVTPYLEAVLGGPSLAVRMMAVALANRGHEVDVVSTYDGNSDESSFDRSISGHRCVRFKRFRRAFPARYFRAPEMAGWMAEHVNSYDLLHIHVPFTWTFRLAAITATKSRIPYVITPHGVLDKWSMGNKLWKKSPYFRFFERKLIARASRIHVSSDIESTALSSLGFENQTRKIELPVLIKHRSRNLQDIKEPSRILFVGRLHPVKGLPFLLETIYLLRRNGVSVFLDIAGSGERAYEKFLRDLATRFHLDDVVSWHGFVNAEKRGQLLERASCLAMFSRHESFGLSAAEALAHGVPVIVSDQVGIASLVQEYKAGEVVLCNHVESAAKALQRLLMPASLLAASEAGKRLASERLNVDIFGRKLDELYQTSL